MEQFMQDEKTESSIAAISIIPVFKNKFRNTEKRPERF
jgi:hypothetical protein